MMRCLLRVMLTYLGMAAICFAQNPAAEIDSLQTKFRAFEYQSVIALSRQLLARGEELTVSQKIEINRLEASAHYTLSDTVSARANFEEILKLDSAFVLDALQNSPKIVQFFNAIKAQFRVPNQPLTATLPKLSADTTAKASLSRPSPSSFTTAVARSLILPGWGHHVYDREKKGWILSGAAIATASAAVFYVIDSHNKEVAYLNEADPAQIDESYNRYNSSYKRRNLFLASYALIWLYSQIDILSLANQNQLRAAAFSLSPILILPSQAGLAVQIVL